MNEDDHDYDNQNINIAVFVLQDPNKLTKDDEDLGNNDDDDTVMECDDTGQDQASPFNKGKRKADSDVFDDDHSSPKVIFTIFIISAIYSHKTMLIVNNVNMIFILLCRKRCVNMEQSATKRILNI